MLTPKALTSLTENSNLRVRIIWTFIIGHLLAVFCLQYSIVILPKYSKTQHGRYEEVKQEIIDYQIILLKILIFLNIYSYSLNEMKNILLVKYFVKPMK